MSEIVKEKGSFFQTCACFLNPFKLAASKIGESRKLGVLAIIAFLLINLLAASIIISWRL